jgi:RHS repeat-associated protein
MGMYDFRYYDDLGNLIADTAQGIFTMEYDYRNLMTYSKFEAGIPGADFDKLYFTYDESGQRIVKDYKYQYWGDCEDPGGGIESFGMGFDIDGDGMAGADGGGGGPTQCLKIGHTYTYYLYDDGLLLATFDEDDNVMEMFVNGQEGMVASYENNDNDLFYYYLTDYLGSPRVIIHVQADQANYQVARYTNYDPFGAVLASSGAYDTPFKFTGKEYDDCSVFEFTYFGARYYDHRLGQFTSLDKAGQFASGYVYCGNNPISLVDADGNLAGFFKTAFEIYGMFMLAKSIGNMQMYLQNDRIPFEDRLIGIGRSLLEMGLWGKVGGGWNTAGLRIAYNKAAYNEWTWKSEIIGIGQEVVIYGAEKFDEWRARVRLNNKVKTLVHELVAYFDENLNTAWRASELEGGWEHLFAFMWMKEGKTMSLYADNFKKAESRDHGVVDDHVDAGEIIEGIAHTHRKGTPFSPGDLEVALRYGYKDIAVIEAGDKRYVLVIIDREKAMKFQPLVRQYYNDTRAEILETCYKKDYANPAIFREDVLKRLLWRNDMGIRMYESKDKKKLKFKEMK